MNEAIRALNETTFEKDVLASPVPVLVDYWAEWCQPCRMIAPIVDEAAARYAGQLEVAKIDVDEYPQLASRYHVRSIPTLMLFKGGRPVATRAGTLDRSQLAAFIEANLEM